MTGFSGQADKLFAAANQTAAEAFSNIRTVVAFQMENSVGALYSKLLQVRPTLDTPLPPITPVLIEHGRSGNLVPFQWITLSAPSIQSCSRWDPPSINPCLSSHLSGSSTEDPEIWSGTVAFWCCTRVRTLSARSARARSSMCIVT